jgi:hypothetical protein
MPSFSRGFSGRVLIQDMSLGLRATVATPTLWGNINSQFNHINSYTKVYFPFHNTLGHRS